MHFLLSSAEARGDVVDRDATECGLDRALVLEMNSFSQLEQPVPPPLAPLADIIRSVKLPPGLAQCHLERCYLLAPNMPELGPSALDYLSDELIHKPKKPAKDKSSGPPVKRKLVHPFKGFALLEATYLPRGEPQSPPVGSPGAMPLDETAASLKAQPADPVPAEQPMRERRARVARGGLRKRAPQLRFSYLSELRRIRGLIKHCTN